MSREHVLAVSCGGGSLERWNFNSDEEVSVCREEREQPAQMNKQIKSEARKSPWLMEVRAGNSAFTRFKVTRKQLVVIEYYEKNSTVKK